jgi:PAS domain S-box-containing protein
MVFPEPGGPIMMMLCPPAAAVSWARVGVWALKARDPVTLASMCTVWAQSDVIKHISARRPVADICAGINAAMANRVAMLANALNLENDICMTGGVAKNKGVVHALARILGYSGVEDQLTELKDGAGTRYVEPGRWSEFLALVLEQGEITDFESRIRRRSGRVVWISENARLVPDSRGKPLYIEGTVEDITLRKEYESQLLHQAFHDPLTSLPNRALFLDHLKMAMERRRRHDKYLFAVLYLDLDRFKVINDSLGHDAGDELLRAVARTLTGCARGMDTVARFGGDEFAILLEELAAPPPPPPPRPLGGGGAARPAQAARMSRATGSTRAMRRARPAWPTHRASARRRSLRTPPPAPVPTS